MESPLTRSSRGFRRDRVRMKISPRIKDQFAMSHGGNHVGGQSEAHVSGPRTHTIGHAYPSADLIQRTIRVWEPRLGRSLTDEDARQIIWNMVGFFQVLHNWDLK